MFSVISSNNTNIVTAIDDYKVVDDYVVNGDDDDDDHHHPHGRRRRHDNSYDNYTVHSCLYSHYIDINVQTKSVVIPQRYQRGVRQTKTCIPVYDYDHIHCW